MNENKNKGCGGCHDKAQKHGHDDDGCCGGCHDHDKDQDQADKNTQKPQKPADGSKKRS